MLFRNNLFLTCFVCIQYVFNRRHTQTLPIILTSHTSVCSLVASECVSTITSYEKDFSLWHNREAANVGLFYKDQGHMFLLKLNFEICNVRLLRIEFSYCSYASQSNGQRGVVLARSVCLCVSVQTNFEFSHLIYLKYSGYIGTYSLGQALTEKHQHWPPCDLALDPVTFDDPKGHGMFFTVIFCTEN